MKVPFMDLNRIDPKIQKEIDINIKQVIASKQFIDGHFTKKFEYDFSQCYEGCSVVPTSSGSTALLASLKAIGIGEGDEVITTPFTFVATIENIINLGAKPVFVDISSSTYNIDPNKIQEKITDKTKAILAVHLFGNPCDMDPIMIIASKNNLLVVEDCAHAHFATYKGKKVGTFGDISAFSFNPGKNLGAYGDAGAVVIKNPMYEKTVRALVDHGRISKYESSTSGYNLRMAEIQASVLCAKLPYLSKWTVQRQNHARIYTGLFKSLGLSSLGVPIEQVYGKHSYHQFVIQTQNRDIIHKELNKQGISVGNHYPLPLHVQPICEEFGYTAGDFPVAERVASQALSLPIYPECTLEEINRVMDSLHKVCS